jgi:rhodanese-related sulfurtransferase
MKALNLAVLTLMFGFANGVAAQSISNSQAKEMILEQQPELLAVYLSTHASTPAHPMADLTVDPTNEREAMEHFARALAGKGLGAANPIIVFCATGKASQQFAELLRARGYPAKNVVGVL